MEHQTQLFAVSVKAVVLRQGRVVLLHNDRDEWELPGGQLELGEQPADCVVREVAEEVGWAVTVGPLLDVWPYHPGPGEDVLIVTFGCHTDAGTEPVLSDEHDQVGLFTEAEVAALRMPAGYRRSIATWYAAQGTVPPTGSSR